MKHHHPKHRRPKSVRAGWRVLGASFVAVALMPMALMSAGKDNADPAGDRRRGGSVYSCA
jgi:hypothetical protein